MHGLNIKHWFADRSFRTILRDASYLGSGKVVAGLLGLAALAFAGRGMTPRDFGTLAIVLAYTKGIGDFIKFQTWQFVVRFGTPALTQRNFKCFRDVTGFSFGLDLISAAVAFVAGVALLPLLAHAVGITPENTKLALLYCTLIPIQTAATPTGILRAFDRFDLVSAEEVIKPVLQAAGGGVSLVFGLGFPGFIASWYLAAVVSGLMSWVLAIYELRRRQIRHALHPHLFALRRRIAGAWDFAWTTNIGHSIWSLRGQGSNLVVGIMLGPAAAGMFKIADSFFDAAGQPGHLLEKSFYPEIMRLDPSTKQPWRLGIRSGALAAGFGLLIAVVVVIIGRPLIDAIFGSSYAEAYDLLRIMVVALIVAMAGFPLESLLYMAKRHRARVIAQSCATVLYIGLLIAMIYVLGITGAAIAYVAGQLMGALFSLVPTVTAYRHRESLSY